MTRKTTKKNKLTTERTPEAMAHDLIAGLEALDTDRTGDALAELFRHYIPPTPKTEAAPEPTPEPTPTALTPDEQALIDAYRAGKPDEFNKVADKATRRLFTDQPYTANWATLGTGDSGIHELNGYDPIGWDAKHLRYAWYIVGHLVESNFVSFDHEKPNWHDRLEHLLIVVSQALKQVDN